MQLQSSDAKRELANAKKKQSLLRSFAAFSSLAT